jgi:DNA-binding response OmpR family regulator
MEILRQVRGRKPHLPVLILTGSARVEDRVDGLDSGADDYLTKPFAFSELSARVRALLRRSSLPFEPVLRSQDLELDRVKRVVNRSGRSIDLTPKEFALLEYLMLNSGRNVSRSSIIHHVWKLSSDTLTNVVDVYINYLRKKIDVNAAERLIHTVRGAGYRFGSRSTLAHQGAREN